MASLEQAKFESPDQEGLFTAYLYDIRLLIFFKYDFSFIFAYFSVIRRPFIGEELILLDIVLKEVVVILWQLTEHQFILLLQGFDLFLVSLDIPFDV